MYLFKKAFSIFLATLVASGATITTVYAQQTDLSDTEHIVTADNETPSEETTPADYTLINRIKKELIPTYFDIYTEDSVAHLQEVLDSIDYTLDSSRQSEVDAYTEALMQAYFGLEVKKADKSYLEEVLAEIPEDLSIFTEESVANLNEAIIKAEAEIVEIDVDDYLAIEWLKADLRREIEKLELKNLDYDAVEIAKSKIPSDLSMYIEETVEALNEVLANPPQNPTLTEMDKWAAEIEAAVKNLELKPADYTAIENALKKIPEDLSLYTKESVAALKAELAKGSGGLGIDRQAEVDAQAQELEAAIAGLKIKEQNVTNVEFTDSGYVVTVEGSAEKIQFIGEGTTRTYTRDSECVTIKSYDMNGKITDVSYQTAYEKWTVNINLPSETYDIIARYRKVWDTLAFEFEVIGKSEKPQVDEKIFSADVKVDGLEVTHTVVTSLGVSKIQITDNGSTKTLAAGYADTDVRTWTYKTTVPKGEHNVIYAYKTNIWHTTETTVEYTATVETENETPEKIIYTGTVDPSVLRGEKVGFAVTTNTAASKIQFVFEDGDTITLASGFEDLNATRTWTYSKEFAPGEYSVKIMAKYGKEWVDTEIVLNFEVC